MKYDSLVVDRCCQSAFQLVCGLMFGLVALAGQAAEPLPFFIGTYTDGLSQGVYYCTLDTQTGELSLPVLAAELKNPSYLVVRPGGHQLFVVSEVAAEGNEGKQLFAYENGPKGAL